MVVAALHLWTSYPICRHIHGHADILGRRKQTQAPLWAEVGQERGEIVDAGPVTHAIGVLRRAHGLTQDQLARAVGTAKSNISRLESGGYGGLTVERFIAVLDAFNALERGRRSA